MNWIKIAVGIMRDPSIISVAEAAGVSVPTTTGHVVGVLTSLPEGARTGDLSGVADTTIERWADWRGKKGRFAEAFRRYLCTPEGFVRSWDKYNGAAMRESETTKERARKWREQRKKEADERRTNGVPNDARTLLRDGTGRDGKSNNKQQGERDALAPRPTPKPKAEKKPPQFPGASAATCDALYEFWLGSVGAVDYGRFKKAVGPLLTSPEDRAPQRPRDEELLPAMRMYLSAVSGTPEARFRTVERCAEALTGVVKVMRDHSDALKQFDAVQSFLGVTQRRLVA